jgi:predicted ATP-grasp superfamily ATP-dependent carboligase
MEAKDGSVKVSKFVVGVVSALLISVLGSAAKAYIDVAELKIKVENYEDNAKYIREDIKEIKKDIKTLLSKGG